MWAEGGRHTLSRLGRCARFLVAGGGGGGPPYPLQTRSLRSLLSVWRGYDAPPSPAVVRLRRHGHRAVEGQVLIELQSHSVVSDGQLEPAGAVAGSAQGGGEHLAVAFHEAGGG